jgi:O-antigen/teichoic acid export membrane protein
METDSAAGTLMPVTGAVEPVLPSTPIPASVPAKAKGTLTRRASLTAAASMLDYFAKAGVSFVITPILVTGLGRSMYGMWEMLGRLGSYMSATDGRPTEALRLVIAQKQAEDDDAGKRRQVGAAMVVWALMLPVILIAGSALSWYLAPRLTKAPAALVGDVRLSCFFIVLAFCLTSLGEVPESVLRGMNLGYRRMGLQSSLNAVGGICAVAAVWMGLGLAGLGGSQLIRAAITGVVYWVLVRKYVHWYGVARPSRPEVKGLLHMSVWLALGDGISKILLASDVLILGSVVAPALVTTYALTSYAARSAVGIHVFTAGAAIPGLGGIIGQKEHDRAHRARRELLLLTWLFATIVGAVVLCWNQSFIALWVGRQNYAGPWVDLLIVAATVQTMFIRIDSYVIDATLQPKLRVAVAALAAVLTIAMSIVLTRSFGLIGLSAGIIVGRLIQTLSYPVLVRRCLGDARVTGGTLRALRCAIVSAALFGAAAATGARITAASWPLWLIGVAATGLTATGMALLLGTSSTDRGMLKQRLRSLKKAGSAA